MGNIRGEVCGSSSGVDGQSSAVGVEGNQSSLQEEAYKRTEREFWKLEKQRFCKAWEGKTKILICEPSIGDINYQAHETMCDLIAALKEYELVSNFKFFKSCLGRLMVSYAREKFAEYAVNVGFDYIMYLDDDHIWPLNIFTKLEKYIKDYDIVAPLCLQRQYPYTPVIYKSTYSKLKDGRTLYNNVKYAEVKEIKKGDIITDADAIGFGACIVKVDLLNRISRPWFFNQVGVGEDIWFCMKAKNEANAKILIDTSIEAPHLKDKEPIYWKDFKKAEWEMKIGAEGKTKYEELDEINRKYVEDKYFVNENKELENGEKSVVGYAKPDSGVEISSVSNVESKYFSPL